jgi:CDP-diacylglycerol--serine O-phosphatidyltransferase
MRRFRHGRAAAKADHDDQHDLMSLGRFLPSGLTLLALCSGTTAIRFALMEHWKAAVIAIIVAAVLDTMDGKIARLLGADSKFGAQLDSLADLVSFGIAPSVLVYLWTLHAAGGAGWTVALVYCACCAIRLARFNIETVEAEDQREANKHFTGVPTPAAACMILLTMLLSFQFTGTEIGALLANPILNAAIVSAAALLMVSRLPTLSLKNFHLPRKLRVLAGLVALGIVTLAVLWPWATLSAGLIVYIAILPLGRKRPRSERRRLFRRNLPPAE